MSNAFLISHLQFLFMCSKDAYSAYTGNGHRFIDAIAIHNHNIATRSLLLNHGHTLPADLYPDMVALVRHYDNWLARWDALERQVSPALTDVFTFETEIPYPREAERRLSDFGATTAPPPNTRTVG
ncbi:MAG: hypothetical protein U0974_13145 [Gemmatimonadales bacterium]|nr:hypothetical protein [Gemmatimonadales bacterium]